MTGTAYEWDIETVDEQGNITHDHWDNLRQAPAPKELQENQRLVLVRDEVVDGSVEDRQWCYVAESFAFEYEQGQPTGKKAPKARIAEFLAWQKRKI